MIAGTITLLVAKTIGLGSLVGAGIVASRTSTQRAVARLALSIDRPLAISPPDVASLSLAQEAIATPDDNIIDIECQSVSDLNARRWLDKARIVAIELSRTSGTVTADDVLAACPLDPGVDPVWLAQVWRPRSEWVKTGSIISRQRHGRSIVVWRHISVQDVPAAAE